MKEPKQTKTTRAIDELKAIRTADKQRKAERNNSEHSSDAVTTKKQPLQVSHVYSSDDDDDDDDERGNRLVSLLLY